MHGIGSALASAQDPWHFINARTVHPGISDASKVRSHNEKLVDIANSLLGRLLEKPNPEPIKKPDVAKNSLEQELTTQEILAADDDGFSGVDEDMGHGLARRSLKSSVGGSAKEGKGANDAAGNSSRSER